MGQPALAHELMDPPEQGSVRAIGACLDALRPGPMHWWLLVTVCAAGFVDFYDLTMGGAIAGALLRQGWSTLFLNSVFFSAAGLGAALGVFCAGFLADRFGRARTLQVSLLAIIVGTVLCAVSPTMTWLIAARLVAAVGMGAVPTVGYVYLAEVLPARVRGAWVSGGGFLIAFSTATGSLSAYYLLPLGAWRWMFAAPAVAALALAAVLEFIPESPRWLAVRGRGAAALKALGRIAHGQPEAPAPSAPDNVVELHGSGGRGAGALFRPPLLRALILGASLATAANVTSNNFISWLPTLLLSGTSMSQGLGQNFLVSLGAPFGGAIGFFVADRFGRRRGLIVSALGAAALALACAFAARAALVPLAFVLMAAINLVCTLILGVYVAEIFPTPLRARGSALSLTVSRLAMIAAPFAFGALLKSEGRIGVMGFLAACLGSAALIVALLGVETARRSLADT